jgi:DNA-binding XRE family transcriptional regulator
MRKISKIPRIIKINKIHGLVIAVVFNNGESRIIDFKKVFPQLHVDEHSPLHKLTDPKHFKEVQLANHTLSWDNVDYFTRFKNKKMQLPFEIGADTLYEFSEPDPAEIKLSIGSMVRKERERAGMTQDELARRSGTTRNYISRIENDVSGIELSTLHKIVTSGLGKSLKISIRP